MNPPKDNNIKSNKDQISIFDANIFLTGIDFNLINGNTYTTIKVIEETKKHAINNNNILIKIQAAIDCKKLIIRTPLNEYIQEVENKSKITGDFNALSETDKELIALAIELLKSLNKPVKIYTNDYSVENICSELGIPFAALTRKGIKKKILWEIYCPFCKDIRKAEDLFMSCERCGSKLKRRPKK